MTANDDVHAPFPLTEIQYAYWVGRGPNFVLGNVAPHAYFELEGRRLDPALLSRAWTRLVERHGMLRCVVGQDGRQRILPEVPAYEIRCTDLRDAPRDETERHLAEVREEMSHRVYTAADWPLFDIRMSRLPAHDRLHVSLDLLMVDLASITLLFSEWAQLCQDEERALPPVDVGFRDYALALERGDDSVRHRRARAYWTARAATLAPPPGLPLAKSPVAVHKPVFTHREFHLPPEDWKRLQGRCEERGLTPTALLATVFSEVLAMWGGTRRFTLNLTLFNRLPLVLAGDGAGHRGVHPHLRRVVGDFTSICLLETDAEGGVPLTERVDRLQRQLRKDLRHRHVSALQALRERRRLGLQNGFETMPVVFTSGLGTAADVSAAMDHFGGITYRISQTPQVWLDHQVVDITGSLDLTWDAVEELFPEGVLDDMFAAYTGAVARLAADDSLWDEDLVIPLPAHQLTAREAANATGGELPAGLLHTALLERAARHPQRPAVITGAGTVSYGELAAWAGSVADRLSGTGLRDRTVGITLGKGPAQVAAAHGVLMAGGAYLPVGPQLPALRRERILADAGAVAVITDAEAEARLEWPRDLPRIVTAPPSGTPAGSAQAGPADPADLAYVIYTSGSTGTPKGVMIEHRAALNTVADINERFGIGPADRFFGLADLGFDLSVQDLFGTFAAGAALVLPDPDQRAEPAHWAEVMAAHGVTVWNSVPAQMQMLVEHLEAGGAGGVEIPQDLRLVLLSGDWIPVDLPGRIHALWPDARVISLGGATEVSIWSIFHPVEEVPAGATSVPYGKPLRNQTFHVLDERYAPCPVWTAGELYIGGHGLARGYRGDPERTAAAFVTHPRTGERLYRTGDFGRYLPDGSIEFLGRRDGQVKINGHRVELGEIEATLTRHPGVDSAVVVKADGEAGTARLLGYVVPARGTAEDGAEDAAGGTPDDADGAGGLFVTEHADPERADADWRALRAAAEVPAPGPSPQALRTAWDVLNEVYATAVGTAFRRLGLPDKPAAAVAPRYERWLARATAARPPAADGIPRELADRSRTVLREVLGIPEDVTDWMLALAGDIAGVLTQSVHSAELYASDRTPGVYERLFGPTYAVATEAVRRLVAGWPADRPLRVLEVGAGYGSLTRHLLPLLPADRAAHTARTAHMEYVFTDISRYFTDRAREVFGAGHPFLRCDLLDLDAPPETQGFEDHSADLVIAASVLHDMRQVRRTLRNLRGLLAPGGTLLIVEQTSFHPWFDLVMGLQQGFDNFEDTDLRTTHPLLGREQWASELAAAGFTDCAVLTPSGGGPGSVGFDVLVARGPARRRRFAPDALREFAAGQLAAHMVPSQLFALTELPLSGTGKVDRKALARAGARTVARGRPVRPPRTDRQRKLVEIWRDVLGLSSADLADDFLEAGGDSLLAARLVATLRTAFGITVPVGTVLQYTTVEALDGHLEGLLGPSEPLTEETR